MFIAGHNRGARGLNLCSLKMGFVCAPVMPLPTVRIVSGSFELGLVSEPGDQRGSVATENVRAMLVAEPRDSIDERVHVVRAHVEWVVRADHNL